MQFNHASAYDFEQKLLQSGYRKYIQNYRKEDYMYWKGFDKQTDQDGDSFGGYSVGFAIYDFSKFEHYNQPDPIHISFHFLLGNNSMVNRLDIEVTDDKITIEKFEKFCSDFYEFWKLTTQEAETI